MRDVKCIRFIASTALGACLLASCGKPAAPPAQAGKALVVARMADIFTFDPFNTQDDGEGRRLFAGARHRSERFLGIPVLAGQGGGSG